MSARVSSLRDRPSSHHKPSKYRLRHAVSGRKRGRDARQPFPALALFVETVASWMRNPIPRARGTSAGRQRRSRSRAARDGSPGRSPGRQRGATSATGWGARQRGRRADRVGRPGSGGDEHDRVGRPAAGATSATGWGARRRYRPRRTACAASSARLVTPSLPKTLRRCVRTVPGLTSSCAPIAALDSPAPRGRRPRPPSA